MDEQTRTDSSTTPTSTEPNDREPAEGRTDVPTDGKQQQHAGTTRTTNADAGTTSEDH